MGSEKGFMEEHTLQRKNAISWSWESKKIKPHALNSSIVLPEVYKALLDTWWGWFLKFIVFVKHRGVLMMMEVFWSSWISLFIHGLNIFYLFISVYVVQVYVYSWRRMQSIWNIELIIWIVVYWWRIVLWELFYCK